MILNPKLSRFLSEHRWATAGLALSLTILIGVSSTLLADAIYFNDPAHKDVELKSWMTPRYVALSYELPRPVMMEVLGIEEGDDFPRRIDRLAASLGLSLEELTAKVRAAKVSYLESGND